VVKKKERVKNPFLQGLSLSLSLSKKRAKQADSTDYGRVLEGQPCNIWNSL